MNQVDISSQVTGDIDPQILDFLQAKVNTFVKWDLVRYFHDNPHAADTADNIARYISREAQIVEVELTELVQANVLQQREPSVNVRVYSLTADDDIRDLVSRFVRACNDRNFRVKAISHVIRAMR